MLPSDIVGTTIYRAQTGTFEAKCGPVFANFVLADEINRAPAKVQSALLEAMQEQQVTLGDETFPLPEPLRGEAGERNRRRVDVRGPIAAAVVVRKRPSATCGWIAARKQHLR